MRFESTFAHIDVVRHRAFCEVFAFVRTDHDATARCRERDRKEEQPHPTSTLVNGFAVWKSVSPCHIVIARVTTGGCDHRSTDRSDRAIHDSWSRHASFPHFASTR